MVADPVFLIDVDDDVTGPDERQAVLEGEQRLPGLGLAEPCVDRADLEERLDEPVHVVGLVFPGGVPVNGGVPGGDGRELGFV